MHRPPVSGHSPRTDFGIKWMDHLEVLARLPSAIGGAPRKKREASALRPGAVYYPFRYDPGFSTRAFNFAKPSSN
jgi:hypothetical protein